jgi:hypothetical protein
VAERPTAYAITVTSGRDASARARFAVRCPIPVRCPRKGNPSMATRSRVGAVASVGVIGAIVPLSS